MLRSAARPSRWWPAAVRTGTVWVVTRRWRHGGVLPRWPGLLANVPARIALQRAILAELRGDADRTVRSASRALALLGEGEWMVASLARTHLAVTEWLRGRLPEAERAFAADVTRWRATGELTVAPGRPTVPTEGIALVGMAEVAYQRGELEDALERLGEGIGLCRQLAYTQPLATGLAALAWIRQAQGDQAGALEAIGEAERVAPSPEVTSLLNPVPARRARLLAAAREQGRLASVIELQGLRSLALAEALALAHPEGYVRVFADKGAPMAALLGRLVSAQRTGQSAAGSIPLDYLGRLPRTFARDTAATGPRGRVGAANRTEATARARELGLLR